MFIDDPSCRGANPNQLDDEDYDDNGSGIEDDAPEGFQALQRPEQSMITFPDLLRVPTTTANIGAEDDSPESLSFASTSGRPVRPSVLSVQGIVASQRSISSPSGGESTDGLSINRRPLSHPDVSQLNLPSLPSTSFGIASTSSMPTRPVPPLPNERHSKSNNVCPSSDTFSSQSLQLILNSISRVQSSIDLLSGQFYERLNSLENRVNEISNFSNGGSIDCNEITSQFLKNFMQEQKRELENQRRSFVLSFAEALKLAANSPNQNGSPEPRNSLNHRQSRP